jgi:response regulator RpfG family c-di-GMP phosphodiesterase
MEYSIPALDTISRQLSGQERSKKVKMLVVDDEPDNLDLLYRTFRREFQVLKAESGIRALEMLSEEGEVAVIISDQRMPEMKGTEFLSRTVPQFPDTMRIILTGFTDVEDLVEAINSGQVYRYITKPWDPGELKVVVQRAVETYEVLKQRTEELRRSQKQTALLGAIVQVAEHSTSLEFSLAEMAKAFYQAFSADRCVVQLVEGQALTLAGAWETQENWLAQDPLVQAAIETRQIQAGFNIATDPLLAAVEHYSKSSIQSHCVVPVMLRGNLLAVLSLQWENPTSLREDEILLLHLAAQQAAMALTCSRAAAA